MTLPPGQHQTDGFPRFGKHLHRPAPAVPIDPVIEISGASAEPFAVQLATLATLPRRELTADLHCVAGWSATNLQWEGVAFETFYRMIIKPSVPPGTPGIVNQAYVPRGQTAAPDGSRGSGWSVSL